MIPGFSELTHYEILDISPDVTIKEIQEGYYRVREIFGKNSIASYSLYTAGERDQILLKIEEAYHTLIDEKAREEYDGRLQQERIKLIRTGKAQQEMLPLLPPEPGDDAAAGDAPEQSVIESGPPSGSGEPEPPAAKGPALTTEDEQADKFYSGTEDEARGLEAGLKIREVVEADEMKPQPGPQPELEELPAPQPVATPQTPAPPPREERRDFSADLGHETAKTTSAPPEHTLDEVTDPVAVIDAEMKEAREAPEHTPLTPPRTGPSPMRAPGRPRPPAVETNAGADHEAPAPGREPFEETIFDLPAPGKPACALDYIEEGVSGKFIRQVREARGMTFEQVWEITRIRRPILQAIEEELYDRLPADVFLKGMIRIYARLLEIEDPEAIVNGYMDRLVAARDWLD